MHVMPSELRMLRQDGIVLRFALLESMAFVLAEIPAGGSGGSAMEQPCVKPHWGFLISGELVIETGGRRRSIQQGSAFHVQAGGVPHQFRFAGAASIAGFEPIDTALDATDAGLIARGYELIGADSIGDATVIPAEVVPLLDENEIDVRAWLMSSLVLTQARFGPGSGYTASWCDAPHWGMVTAGRLALEWEDDIEILSAGDVYHCPGGPPGHRLEAADPAAVIDLTPITAFGPGKRMAFWRELPVEAPRAGRPRDRVAVAGLG